MKSQEIHSNDKGEYTMHRKLYEKSWQQIEIKPWNIFNSSPRVHTGICILILSILSTNSGSCSYIFNSCLKLWNLTSSDTVLMTFWAGSLYSISFCYRVDNNNRKLHLFIPILTSCEGSLHFGTFDNFTPTLFIHYH